MIDSIFSSSIHRVRVTSIVWCTVCVAACSGGSSSETPVPDTAAPVAATQAPQEAPTPPPAVEPATADAQVSPAFQIQRRGRPDRPRPDPRPELAERTLDGSNNNLANPAMGAVGVDLQRLTFADYSDGESTLAGIERPGARAISNAVSAQMTDTTSSVFTTDFLWQWGQFLDHDIDLTDGTDPPEPANIPVPSGDAFFDPNGTGTVSIRMNRSIYHEESVPRQQINEISSWIDASNVYGSEDERAAELRTLDGTGRLKVSEGNLLPFNENEFPNAGGGNPELFLAGDVRANEQAGLTVMHTLFMREHNRLVESLAESNPDWSGERLYQKARQLVGAQMQVITFEEFLPALTGGNSIRRYQGYNDNIDSTVANEFAHAAYRLGHSMLSEFILRVDAGGEEIADGHLSLRDAFFNPAALIDQGGIDPFLRGLALQKHQAIDTLVVDDVRNFLFGPPGAGGFDLASLNIQRGRDHGLPGYNDVREALGLVRRNQFAQVSSNDTLVQKLQSVYSTVDEIDLWVGGLAEDPVEGSQLGELFQFIVTDQFRRLRDGDRYWYELTLTNQERAMIEQTKLSDIIRRNTDIGNEIQDNVFIAVSIE